MLNWNQHLRKTSSNGLTRIIVGIWCCGAVFSAHADPYWGEFSADACTQIMPGKRQYSAILHDIPWGQSWEDTCASMGATINGETFDSPTRCVNNGLNMWGEFDVSDNACEANWAALVGTEYYTHQDDGCVASGEHAGKRKYSSRLWNVAGMSWEEACAAMPMTLAGQTFDTPDACVNEGAMGIWGEWYVADSQCEATGYTYTRGVEDGLADTTTPLTGYVDLHAHLMAHLGFGGIIFHGEPYGNVADALADCPSGDDDAHAEGHGRVEAILQDDLVDIASAALGSATHDNTGYSEFSFWPAYNSYTHQTMYYEWLKRAYEGGLRAMVVLAVNGDYMFGATDNGLPDIIKGISIAENPIYDLDDMATLVRQTQAVYAMEEWVDNQYGGPGQGWFRIVTSPAQAQSVIAAGKLAVILGSEVDYLIGCTPTSCDPTTIESGVNALYDLGIRYVFPVHLKTNGFGGAALYNILASGDSYDCKHYGQDCNVEGLTSTGSVMLNALMNKGMMVDVGHMSAKTFSSALDIFEQANYPGVAVGHTGLYDMANGANRHEGNISGTDLQRITALGGMVGLILGQGNREETAEWRGDASYIAHACGGTSQTFAQSYLYMQSLLGSGVNQGQLTIGSDFNGFAHLPGPRFGEDACAGGVNSAIVQPDSSKVSYPFAPDTALITPATQNQSVTFTSPYQLGTRTFDYNTQGLSHIGLMPEFFEDLRQQGVKRSELESVYRSAGYFTQMWQAASQYSGAQ